MKKSIFDLLSNWLMEHGEEWHEADSSSYKIDFLFIHAIFIHDSRWQWVDLDVSLFYCITLFRYFERK